MKKYNFIYSCFFNTIQFSIYFLQNQLLKAVQDKDYLKEQLDLKAEYLDTISAKNFDLEKLSRYLKTVIEEKEDYETDLKKMILNMKEKS